MISSCQVVPQEFASDPMCVAVDLVAGQSPEVAGTIWGLVDFWGPAVREPVARVARELGEGQTSDLRTCHQSLRRTLKDSLTFLSLSSDCPAGLPLELHWRWLYEIATAAVHRAGAGLTVDEVEDAVLTTLERLVKAKFQYEGLLAARAYVGRVATGVCTEAFAGRVGAFTDEPEDPIAEDHYTVEAVPGDEERPKGKVGRMFMQLLEKLSLARVLEVWVFVALKPHDGDSEDVADTLNADVESAIDLISLPAGVVPQQAVAIMQQARARTKQGFTAAGIRQTLCRVRRAMAGCPC